MARILPSVNGRHAYDGGYDGLCRLPWCLHGSAVLTNVVGIHDVVTLAVVAVGESVLGIDTVTAESTHSS